MKSMRTDLVMEGDKRPSQTYQDILMHNKLFPDLYDMSSAKTHTHDTEEISVKV